MINAMHLEFKIASEKWEFDEIYRLNHRTFVEEISQHAPNAESRLIDRFDHQNEYLICLKDSRLLGMMSICDKRPFSLDQKLKNLDAYLPPGRRVCEVRLLSVEKDFRSGRVLWGLLRLLGEVSRQKGYELGIISGTLNQLKLYEHLGFVLFGPIVGKGDALFQPMYITMEMFEQKFCSKASKSGSASMLTGVPVNLLPGPVSIRPHVKQAS